ncbi:MAG: hypothetical protein JWN76_2457, partial [Chitinophagaceae bacterium]|nr:hypothetical protein [Chitinophagaceae bacterium]
KKLKHKGACFESDAQLLFSFQMIQSGERKFSDPSGVLLSASAAKAYFGDRDPINQIIQVDNFPPLTVTGVYKDFPENSQWAGLQFAASWDLYFNHLPWKNEIIDPWRPNFVSLYVELNDNADYEAVSKHIKDVKLKNVNADLAKKKPSLFLFAMKDWHLYSSFEGGKKIGGQIQYVYMFGIIGVLILLLACINFMNLSTARSEKRAKEVGIRKTLGSNRKQLIYHFFTESFLTVSCSFILAVMLVQVSSPLFSSITGKSIMILWNNPIFWVVCLMVVIVTALISGSYPAFYLSSFNPIKVLKGSFNAGRSASLPRKSLLVLQLTISVSFIFATVVVYRQIRFAKNRPVGYTRERLLSIPVSDTSVHTHFDAIKTEMEKTKSIYSVAESGSTTTAAVGTTGGISWPGKDPNLATDFSTVWISYDYGKTVGWQLAAGRDFSRQFTTDSSSIILNKAAADFMGIKNPAGSSITWFDKKYTIIGVIKNMVTNSPYETVKPAIYGLLPDPAPYLLVSINPAADAHKALEQIESVFKKFTAQAFEYEFADADYARKFADEERVGTLSAIFTVLAIIISCLGLFGLISFIVEQRKKEIWIRKVLGASVTNIWLLLSTDFSFLIIMSLIIAFPFSYYFINEWLQHYAYRTELSWWIFAAAGVSLFALAITTVSIQAIKAAYESPTKTLKTQ